jgi:hypothetical protein
MLHSIRSLSGYKVRSSNGDIGRLVELYFDDTTWTVRYLLVDIGDWAGGPSTVYVSPLAIGRVDWEGKRIDLALSREQVSESPGLRDNLLVTRQAEAGYYQYHRWPYYWTGPARWGAWETPAAAAAAAVEQVPVPWPDVRIGEIPGLRSANAVSGYPVQATDGHLGRARDFLIDGETWGIVKIEIDTTRWLPGGEALITPEQVSRLDWSEHNVYVRLSRAELKALPEFRPGASEDQ